MSERLSRRNLITTGIAAAAGASGLETHARAVGRDDGVEGEPAGADDQGGRGGDVERLPGGHGTVLVGKRSERAHELA